MAARPAHSSLEKAPLVPPEQDELFASATLESLLDCLHGDVEFFSEGSGGLTTAGERHPNPEGGRCAGGGLRCRLGEIERIDRDVAFARHETKTEWLGTTREVIRLRAREGDRSGVRDVRIALGLPAEPRAVVGEGTAVGARWRSAACIRGRHMAEYEACGGREQPKRVEEPRDGLVEGPLAAC